jgi:hypothetical protein
MPYTKNQMCFHDYHWAAIANYDNPKFIAGSDQTELDRVEGYEILFFINSLAKTWNWSDNEFSCKHLEQIIRNEVPSTIITHSRIKDWISSNYNKI